MTHTSNLQLMSNHSVVTTRNILSFVSQRAYRRRPILRKAGGEPTSRSPVCVGFILVQRTELPTPRNQTINSFVVAKKPPPLPVTKAGMKEFILELIVDGDLVLIFPHLSVYQITYSFLCSHFSLLGGQLYIALSITSIQKSRQPISQGTRLSAMQSLRKLPSLTQLISS